MDSPTAPGGPIAPGTAIVYSAVGASDATGHGGSVECVPFVDCPNGTGYVPVTSRSLQSQGYQVTMTNLGIPTAVIGPDFQSLGRQYGRTILGNFLVDEMPFVRSNSTLVTIFAGGNEVNTITAALGAGAGGSDPAGYVDSQVRAFGSDYSSLISGIRLGSPSARIVVLNLPNFGALPFLAGASLAQREAAQRASVGMATNVVNPLISQNGLVVVDLMCDSRTYQSSNYSSDGFHPNDAGYAFIAAEVVKAATTAYPAPRGSCSQMTLVP